MKDKLIEIIKGSALAVHEFGGERSYDIHENDIEIAADRILSLTEQNTPTVAKSAQVEQNEDKRNEGWLDKLEPVQQGKLDVELIEGIISGAMLELDCYVRDGYDGRPETATNNSDEVANAAARVIVALTERTVTDEEMYPFKCDHCGSLYTKKPNNQIGHDKNTLLCNCCGYYAIRTNPK